MTRGLYKKKVLVIPPRVPGAKVMTPEIINAQIRAANPDAPLLPSKPPDSTVTAQIKAAAEAVAASLKERNAPQEILARQFEKTKL